MKTISLSVFVWILVYALLAPMPWGIALNLETGECAGYWGGDEYGKNRLPKGWQAYYPDKEHLIHTEVGVCHWDHNAADWNTRPEKCCAELGHTYVGPNIGKGVPTLYTIFIILFLFSICAIGVMLIFGVLRGIIRLVRKVI